MKIDHQENCEYRFSSIVIDFIDFYRYYRFFLFHFNFSEKRNRQEISFVLRYLICICIFFNSVKRDRKSVV